MRTRASDKNGKDAYCTGSEKKRRVRALTVNTPAVASTARTQHLPDELLLLILEDVFPRREPDTPSSDHYPLRGTSHVLLVSRKFRELALPFFLRAITITRAADYATFFGQEDGLFAGEKGAKLWNLVREISLVRSVYLPLRQPAEPGPTFTYPLSVRTGHPVRQVCLLDCRLKPSRYENADRWLREPGAMDLIAAEQEVDSRRAAALSALRAEYDAEIAERRAEIEAAGGEEDEDEVDLNASYEMSLWTAYRPGYHLDEDEDGDWDEPDEVEQTARLVAEAIDGQIEYRVHMEANIEKDSFIISLIGATSPTLLHERYPSDLGLYAEAKHPGTESTYVQHYPITPLYFEIPPEESWQYDTSRVTKLWRVRHVRLAPDYPDDIVREVLNALKAADGLPIVSAIRKWSWSTPEGQIFELDMADLTTKQVNPPLSLGEATT